MATALNILSWNVRGLGDGVKRVALFSTLKKYAAAVVCLQETDLQPDTLSTLKRGCYQTQFHSTHMAFSREVSILIANTKPFTLLQSLINDFYFAKWRVSPASLLLCISLHHSPQPSILTYHYG